MTVLLGLLAFFLVLDLAALTGWAPSTRDGADWERSPGAPARRGPVRLPATWAAADLSSVPTVKSAGRPRHASTVAGVVSSQPSGSRSTSACDTHAAAA